MAQAPAGEGPVFYVVEVDVYRPGSNTVDDDEGWAAAPHAALAEFEEVLDSSDVVRASDMGYRTREEDEGGLRVFPPLLVPGFSVDRRVGLDPGKPNSSAAWGSLSILNLDGSFDGVASTTNCDGRGVRIYIGRRPFCSVRRIFTDPAFADVVPLFQGIAQPWFLGEKTLEIPVRDAGYWIERPYQTSHYAGTGGYEGDSDLTGRPKPRARGGTVTDPIPNVTPVLIDPVNLIYQYNDGPGSIVALYEGGDTGIVYQGDTNNLYAGSTSAGQYRTDNSRGLFQLGSPPQRLITCSVTGAFPVAGTKTTCGSLARYILTEDMGVPAEYVDISVFDALDAAFPYTAGFYEGSGEDVSADSVLSFVLGSLNARLLPTRDGRLSAFALRAIPSGASAAVTLDAGLVARVIPRPLGSPLDPPPYRLRWGYQRNYTVQDSDLDPDVGTARKQFLAEEYRFAAWADPIIPTKYRKPSDPPFIRSALLVQSEAQEVVNAVGELWGTRRRLYDVEVPVLAAVAREIGDVVLLRYPLDDLNDGRLGQIVGEQLRPGDSSAILQVLV